MTRISKKEWVALGGLKNTDLYRVQKNGRWVYYKGAVDG
ncbi:hypothetical protein EVC30_088 [Rhizobium phage RHph_Y1_11]|nr:hypothetical protein EVC30_088 [Rhizobium phage RHph_Y1_11]